MARGRFISNDVISDKEMNDLSSDTCRLAYVYLITIADREGRVAGDPAYLKSLLFPRRYDITPDMIREFIMEWVEAGFVIWYECNNGDKALRLINFEKHQKGLRKDRETASEYDDPAYCRILAGDILENGKDLKEKDNKELLINNVNVNGNSDKKDGKIPDVVGINSGFDSDLFDDCKRIYETKKGRLVTDGQAFVLMIKNFVRAGVTAEDYAAAIDAMDADPRYKASKPTSYEKWAIGYAEKRKQPVKVNGKQELDIDALWADVKK